ncbi:MAG: carotenoid synthesis regulator CarF [Myxococcales bacterium]|nr:carotenoid synthesis regulator CarF [Myxococcales bacterium]
MRAVDVAGMAVFFLFQGLLAREVLAGLEAFPGHAWWVLTLAGIGGYLWADFVSGFVHFLADNFGSIHTPFLGPVFFRTFREHHVDPLAITRHGFLEVNGANCVVSIPFVVGTYYLVPVRETLLGLAFGAFMFLFLVGIFLTNQFHRWAHLPAAPRWIRALQATGLILGPAHHQRHHTPPFDTYYCITSGLMNPILTRIGFFEAIKGPLGRAVEPIIGRAEEVVVVEPGAGGAAT